MGMTPGEDSGETKQTTHNPNPHPPVLSHPFTSFHQNRCNATSPNHSSKPSKPPCKPRIYNHPILISPSSSHLPSDLAPPPPTTQPEIAPLPSPKHSTYISPIGPTNFQQSGIV